MRIAMTGCGGTGKTTLAKALSEHYGWPLNPVGARSVAASMGFVDAEGDAKPFDVDRADLDMYESCLRDGFPPFEAAKTALAAFHAHRSATARTVRNLFQKRLRQAKIDWELAHDDFVVDRTTIDDLAYSVLHCRDNVDKAFIDSALHHRRTRYDVVFYLPRAGGQWLSAVHEGNDAYYAILEALIVGFDVQSGGFAIGLDDRDGPSTVEERVAACLRGVDAHLAALHEYE